MSEVFISYARSTEDQARQIGEALRALGYGVWRDDELPAHQDYSKVIEERLRSAKAVVVVWSAEAVKSQWVCAEADVAREAGTLVQLNLDATVPPLPFNRIQCADMRDWNGDLHALGWRKVAASVADLVGANLADPPARAPTPARNLSICVLPFANMSGDAEQEYFSDGISEDIITDLSKVSALSVVSRNTAFTFKGKSIKVTDVARELNVSHVLEGSVRKAGNRVRITAQLINASVDDHIWAERYDRDLTDIFALQDEISEAIVAALRLKLLPEDKKAIERRGTDSAEAYDLYLMARQHSLSSSEGDPRRNETIVRLCRRAVEIDPDYAQAWALLALGQTLHFYFADKQEGDDGLAAVERAMALDASLAEPHAVKARHLANRGAHDQAAAEIALALRLDPESFEVNSAAASLSFRQRRLDETIRYFEKAMSLMEADLGSPGMLLSCYTALGDEASLRRTAEIALARSEKALAQEPTNGKAMGFGVNALAALGEGDRAREWIARALLLDPDNRSMRFNFACALNARLGDAEGALGLLEPIFPQASAAFLAHIKADTDIDSLRDDPRFVAMLDAAEMRLAAAGAAAKA
ncbi:MAG TPA: TIR domain-containing protein [Caulobacteraceae bacterium]